jgi:hypothetical protein
VDRCALFVDAGYVLADGAMAVHGTRQRGSVSWDYAGLVKLLTGLSRDRTGLPVLRSYWYEATVEGRRAPEHDTLADIPGLKLRLGRMRPGRREGVQSEMHRDLVTLARNRAVSDAIIVSAEEDLAEIVAEVQDLGMRVVIVQITVDGNSTMSRPLRQECDDIAEVSAAHLRPFVDLIAGAEPADRDEQYSNGSYSGRRREAPSHEAPNHEARSYEAPGHEARSYEPRSYEAPGHEAPSYDAPVHETRSYEAPMYQRRALANGHGTGIGAMTHQGLPAAALPAPPTIYTSPVVEDYQRTAQPPTSGATGAGPVGPGSVGPGSVGPGSPAAPQGAAPPAPAFPAPAPTAPAVSSPPSGPASAAGSPPPADPAQYIGPARQAGPSAQAGPAHQANHGLPPAMPGEQVAPQDRRGFAPGQPGEPQDRRGFAPGQPGEPQDTDAARDTFGSRQAQGTGRPGAHASQPFMAPPPMSQPPMSQPPMSQPAIAQAPMPQAPPPPPPLASPVAQPGNVPFGHDQGNYRSPEHLGPRPGRDGPAGEGPGSRDDMSREGMSVPRGEAGRPAGPAAARFADLSAAAPPAPAHSAPAQQMPAHSMPPRPGPDQQMPAQQMPGQPTAAHQYPSGPPGPFGGGGPGQMPPHQQYPGSQPGPPPTSVPGSGYPPPPQHQQGPYSGPQSAAHPSMSQPVPQPMTVSLAEAVQAAHAEGFGFGDAVARDAPALWLEAVLARKPRMPSDLEARLLQGSALPIDSLLHDEVRHSLRRGFWDALERSRR